MNIVEQKLWENNKVKLLGVTTGNKLKFDSHIANIYFKTNKKLSVLSRLASLLTFDKLKFDSHIASICFKTNQKLSVLSRMASLLTFDTKRILFKAFYESQL